MRKKWRMSMKKRTYRRRRNPRRRRKGKEIEEKKEKGERMDYILCIGTQLSRNKYCLNQRRTRRRRRRMTIWSRRM